MQQINGAIGSLKNRYSEPVHRTWTHQPHQHLRTRMNRHRHHLHQGHLGEINARNTIAAQAHCEEGHGNAVPEQNNHHSSKRSKTNIHRDLPSSVQKPVVPQNLSTRQKSTNQSRKCCKYKHGISKIDLSLQGPPEFFVICVSARAASTSANSSVTSTSDLNATEHPC